MTHMHALLPRFAGKNLLARVGWGLGRSAQRLALAAAMTLVGLPLAQAQDASLSVADGVIVKFGADAGLHVRSRLTTAPNVVFTSDRDDEAAGQMWADPETPEAGDWLGVIAAPDVIAGSLRLDGLSIRYAGGSTGLPGYMQGGAGLSLGGADHDFAGLQLLHNIAGVRVTGPGSPAISQSRFFGNQVGVLVGGGATPVITESDIAGNTQFGVQNLTPASIVDARGNWWGDAFGPRATDNPQGAGDAVTAGVDYGEFLQAEPVLTCTIVPQAGYVTQLREVVFVLDCPQAVQYRLAETDDFDQQPWQDMDGVPTLASHTLSSGAGDKMVYVQFRTVQGSTNTFALSQPMAYAPTGPLVQFEQPAANAVLTVDAQIVVAASDAEGIREVTLSANGQQLAVLDAPPYQYTWPLAGVRNGNYTLSAKATNLLGLSNTATRQVRVEKENTADAADIDVNFAGQPVLSGMSITEPGTLTISASSDVGIAHIRVALDGIDAYNRTYSNASPVTLNQFIDFADLPNGSHTLLVVVTDGDGLQSQSSMSFVLALAAPPAPHIKVPATDSQVNQSQLTVSGTAMPGASVQVYVDGQPSGGPLSAGASGGFSTRVELIEGAHQITAQASNSRGQGPMSTPVSVTYTLAVPTIQFVSPVANAILTTDTQLQVNVVDVAGVAQVDFYVNDQLLGTRASAPWSQPWPVESLADGDYVLRAVATNVVGKTAEDMRQVRIEKFIPPPPPPPAPYAVRNVQVAPALSYGDASILISGEVADTNGQLVPSATLHMVLTVEGFEHHFNLVTNGAGQFNYPFTPQASDAGTYEVRLLHPDVANHAAEPPHGRFTINRLSPNYTQYKLNAIRGFASSAELRVKASKGTGASGVHWQARPEDQPSGALPPGITLEMGEAVDIPAGRTVSLPVKLTGSPGAGVAGTVILKLFADDSGAMPRAEVRLDYQLHEARPGLRPIPTALEFGVRQTESNSGTIQIRNEGYSAAQNVQVQLQARDGGAPEPWARLASAPAIGAIDLGESAVVQVMASPGEDVPDGYYQMQLRITADNDSGGTVPVTVAVQRTGEGSVRFKLVDIYTNTLNEQGQLIEGMAGGRITLQNEALTRDILTATSNEQGIAEFVNIPPGNYRWRISARNHSDASGRITVHAGLTAEERVFLDYQVVSIEFNVVETTIQDEYNIVLEATFQAQVPAPVLLLEPTSINLPAMQQGEMITGELTLSNYGLVRADNLKYALPSSDANYKYEFFGDMPTQLDAKSRIRIPYRITAIQPVQKGLQLDLLPAQKMELFGAGYEPSPQLQGAIRQFLKHGDRSVINDSDTPMVAAAAKAASCSSYHSQVCVAYDYECASGDITSGSVCSSISRITGQSCGSSSGGGGGGLGGGWGGGWGGGGSAIPMAPSCTPECESEVCRCKKRF